MQSKESFKNFVDEFIDRGSMSLSILNTVSGAQYSSKGEYIYQRDEVVRKICDEYKKSLGERGSETRISVLGEQYIKEALDKHFITSSKIFKVNRVIDPKGVFLWTVFLILSAAMLISSWDFSGF